MKGMGGKRREGGGKMRGTEGKVREGKGGQDPAKLGWKSMLLLRETSAEKSFQSQTMSVNGE